MSSLPSLNALPAAWRAAIEREKASGKPCLADPLPERRVARLLAAFIATGLFFMVLPGTLVGVWNLVSISAHQHSGAAPTGWTQAHGHAQLFGWVATFLIGISLYTFPKFRGGQLRSLSGGWAMLALWTLGVAARWFSAAGYVPWSATLAAAACELSVALLLIWQCSAAGASHKRGQAWESLVFGGLAGLVLTMGLQFAIAFRMDTAIVPEVFNRTFLSLGLWVFCLPVVLGFSARFLPALLGLTQPSRNGARLTLALTALSAALWIADWLLPATAASFLTAVAGVWTIRVFHPAIQAPKTRAVDSLYPYFARIAFAWLLVSGILAFGASRGGMLGASRHAFTVGFLSTMILAVGPRILPSFLNSRELKSTLLMRISLFLLTSGCLVRVLSEPLAYGGRLPFAWSLLPASAVAELTALFLFAVNLAWTLLSPPPAWVLRQSIHDGMKLYWFVSSYPGTRAMLIREGIATLGRVASVPQTLSLREAAEADGVNPKRLVGVLADYLEARLARSLREQLAADRSSSMAAK
jgi:uncharacterized protein involved in response to NO